MWELTAAYGVAFWLGIQTSISPCPMATNIAAISYIGRRVGSPWLVFWSGVLYGLGRTLAYVAVAGVIVAFALSVSKVALVLPKYVYPALGPVLILVGMILLGLLQPPVGGSGVSEKMQKRVDALGIWGALMLGILFALSFCPVSAAWFFGSLIPLSLKMNSALVLPSLYGIGTALPVLVFAVLIARGAKSLGKAFDIMAKVEFWGRVGTGVLFIALGIFLSLKYIFEVI